MTVFYVLSPKSLGDSDGHLGSPPDAFVSPPCFPASCPDGRVIRTPNRVSNPVRGKGRGMLRRCPEGAKNFSPTWSSGMWGYADDAGRKSCKDDINCK
ncbi:hypothetical protein Barb4_02849 [Bacteroidales bacterium Barb4]|nr:hypothetical protein Barb4_02849 [Bacteroidales bacterium Barb4]